ncbi:MAG: hypothetical protein ACI9RO_002420 [Alteromonas macleodii]|jgi:hypothetical protein
MSSGMLAELQDFIDQMDHCLTGFDVWDSDGYL